MFVVSYILITTTLTAFGMAAAVAAVIVCIGLYFFTDIFHKYTPKASDAVTAGLASYDPIIKTCGKLPEVQFSKGGNQGEGQGQNQDFTQGEGQGQIQDFNQGQGQNQDFNQVQGQNQDFTQGQGQNQDFNQNQGQNQDFNQGQDQRQVYNPINSVQVQVQQPPAPIPQAPIPLQQTGAGWKNRSRNNRKI
jgi:hypothetical protein